MSKQMRSIAMQQPQTRGGATNDEFGKAEKDIVLCSRCHQMRIGKKWRTATELLEKKLTAHKTGVHVTLCPACSMITKKLYEGEILIDSVPVAHEGELVSLITNFGARAQDIDPQDRIIAIERTKKGHIRITTTEDQLAVKIAKKIKSSFKKVDMHIKYSAEPQEVVLITIHFLA